MSKQIVRKEPYRPFAVRRSTGSIVLAFASALGLAAAAAPPQRAAACPFCSAVQMTLSQELDQADVAVIAQLTEPMPDLPQASERFAPGQPTYDKAKFRIIEKIRGAEKLAGTDVIEVVYFGDDGPDKRFLITGISDDRLDWTTPLPLSPRGVDYVKQLDSVAESGADRLAFFQDFLEDEDRLLAQDAYDEFARAPYNEVTDLGPRMHREQLLEWIDDPTVGPSWRRLYLTMLGVCGRQEDVQTLESMINFDHALMEPGIVAAIAASQLTGGFHGAGTLNELVKAEERRKKESLDALLACYLKLTGPAGLELVNSKFLGNPDTEYKYMHSAIMALRFHAAETDVLPREDLLASMRLALRHPDFADQVVPDLAQWEDWDVMPRLVQMFKESSVEDWIRQPVASYLLVAAEQPGDVGADANAALDELEQMDPKTIERARSLSAFSLLAGRGSGSVEADAGNSASPSSDAGNAETPAIEADSASVAATQASESAKLNVSDTAPVDGGDSVVPGAAGGADSPAGDTDQTDLDAVADTEASAARASAADSGAVASADDKATESTALATTQDVASAPNRLAMIGIPLLAALVLMAVFAAILRGGDPHPPAESS